MAKYRPRLHILVPLLGPLLFSGVVFAWAFSELDDVLTGITIERKTPDSQLLRKALTSPLPSETTDYVIQKRIVSDAISGGHKNTVVVARRLSRDGGWKKVADNMTFVEVVPTKVVKHAISLADRMEADGEENKTKQGFPFSFEGTKYHLIEVNFPLRKNEPLPTGQLVLVTNLDASVKSPKQVVSRLLVFIFVVISCGKLLVLFGFYLPVLRLSKQVKLKENADAGWWAPKQLALLGEQINADRAAVAERTEALEIARDKAEGYAKQIEENQRIWRHDLLSTAKGSYDMFDLLEMMGFRVEEEGYSKTYALARSASENCYNLIKETRKLGSLEADIKVSPYSVRQLLTELAAKYTQYNVIVLIPEEEDWVLIDCAELRDRGLCNLINNAIRYSDPPRERVELSYRSKGGLGYFFVKDNGIGISEEGVKKIMGGFGEGVRLNPQIQGSGLGLYSARRIFAAHGGSLTVRSELGKGSVFIASVPRSTKCK